MLKTIRFQDIEAGMPEKRGWKLLYQLGIFFPVFFLMNILFLGVSLGIVTIPAGVSAMNRVFLKILRHADFHVIKDFFGEFRASFFRSLGLGMTIGLIFLVSLTAPALSLAMPAGTVKIISVVISSFITLLTFLLLAYALAMTAATPLPAREIMFNALLLTLIGGRHTFRLIFFFFLYLIQLWVFPFSIILILLGTPAFLQFYVMKAAYAAVHSYVITDQDHEEEASS